MGSSDLMKNLLIFSVPNETVAFEGAVQSKLNRYSTCHVLITKACYESWNRKANKGRYFIETSQDQN